MKPGSIYAAFQSKENLFLLALDRYIDDSLAALRHAADKETSPLAVLDRMLRHFGNAAQPGTVQKPCFRPRPTTRCFETGCVSMWMR